MLISVSEFFPPVVWGMLGLFRVFIPGLGFRVELIHVAVSPHELHDHLSTYPLIYSSVFWENRFGVMRVRDITGFWV